MRLQSLRMAGAALACAAALAALGAQAPERGQAWPMFRGTPALTGVTGAALPSPLALRWRYEAKDSIESSAAILDGVVYVDQFNRWNYCGPANLAMALKFWGWKGNRDDIARVIKPGMNEPDKPFIDRGKTDKNVMPYEMVNRRCRPGSTRHGRATRSSSTAERTTKTSSSRNVSTSSARIRR